MLNNSVKAYNSFINFFSGASPTKKIYILMSIMAFGLINLIQYYDGKLKDKDVDSANRIVALTDKLENCNQLWNTTQANIISKLLEVNMEVKIQKEETDQLRKQTLKLKKENMQLNIKLKKRH